MDPPFINEHSIHFEVSFDTSLLCLVLDERVLQRVLGLPVSHYLTLLDWTKPRENHLQIMLLSNWVQFANKQSALRRICFGIRKVINYLKNLSSLFRLMVLCLLLDLLFSHVLHYFIEVHIVIYYVTIFIANRRRRP